MNSEDKKIVEEQFSTRSYFKRFLPIIRTT